ncbi:MAG: ATP-binding protein [Candidatus Diapherotrites archaeon]|nr:ATP-binding protein [Candidatus Diapherotrites archaeon]
MKEILIEQREILEEKIKNTKVIERERKNEFLESALIKVTTGVRRCGKSFFTYLILKEKPFGYANFDDERILTDKPQKILSALLEIYGKGMKVLFFDEIQNLEKWELFVNRLHREGYNIFLTGSNAKLLSRELATHLTGRHYSIELFPFSFREYLRATDFRENLQIEKGKALVKHELNNYLKTGGFPEIIVEKENPKIYLRELFRDIIEKDIILRYNIRYRRTFKEIASAIVSNTSSLISFNKIKNNFGLKSEHTAKNYIEYLKEAYLIILLDKFSVKPKEIERSPKKAYAVDTGFVNFVGLRTSENTGKLIENLVAIELLRRKSYWHNGWELYYWKDYQQHEVDFVVKEGMQVKKLIQVTYTSGIDEIEKREIKALLKASKQLKCNNLLCITWDYEATEEIKGKKIRFIPLWKFLLNI